MAAPHGLASPGGSSAGTLPSGFREYAGAIFATELIERVGKGDGAGEVAESGFKIHPHMLRLRAGECRPRHPGNPGLDGA
jgi:hypothetical protein